jgi:hypothetical protein
MKKKAQNWPKSLKVHIETTVFKLPVIGFNNY